MVSFKTDHISVRYTLVYLPVSLKPLHRYYMVITPHSTVPHFSERLPLAHVVSTVSAEREKEGEREGEKQTGQARWESNI